MNNFGEFLKECRMSQALPLRLMAKYLDIHYAALSNLEKNKFKPSRRLLDKLSKEFNIAKDWVYFNANIIPSDIKNMLLEDWNWTKNLYKDIREDNIYDLHKRKRIKA